MSHLPFKKDISKPFSLFSLKQGCLNLKQGRLKRALTYGLQAALMAVLCSSRLMSELSPFACACFAAALDAGWPCWFMLGGCLVHALIARGSLASLAALLGCALIAALHHPASLLIKRLMKRRSQTGLTECTQSALATLGTLLPGLIFSHALPFNVLTACLSAAIAALLAPSIAPALTLRPLSRRRYLTEERLAAALYMLMLLIALGSSPFFGVFFAQCAAVLVTLLCASQGIGLGAAGGAACGAALALGTGLAPAGSALALSGLLAGCTHMLPRPAGAIALLAGNALALTQGIGFTPGRIDTLPLLLGGALYCALPQSLMDAAARLLKTGPAAQSDMLPARRTLSRQLERLSHVFETLADGYAAEAALPGEGELIARLRREMCADCPDYRRCWEGDHPEAGRLMCRLLSEALSGRIIPLCERSPELIRHCRRSAQIDRRVGPILLEVSERCRTLRQRGDMKSVVSGQLRQSAAFLSEMSLSVAAGRDIDPDMTHAAAAALEKIGCSVQSVCAVREPRPEITAVLRTGCWTDALAQAAAQALGQALCCPLAPLKPFSQALMRFRAAPRLHIRAGVSITALQSGQPCGDSIHIGLLPDGRLLAVLSDGMGSGERAAAESRRTVRLIRTFLEAGLDSLRSLEAINALLQLQSGELFATVDLCLIDLQSGQASLSKLGACSSLLIHNGRARTLPGGHLPIGILEKITPGEERFTLQPGDTLILCSDGIADDLREGQMQWLSETALSACAQPPQIMAQTLRQAALSRQGGTPDDDMSLVVMRIERRAQDTPVHEKSTPMPENDVRTAAS